MFESHNMIEASSLLEGAFSMGAPVSSIDLWQNVLDLYSSIVLMCLCVTICAHLCAIKCIVGWLVGCFEDFWLL